MKDAKDSRARETAAKLRRLQSDFASGGVTRRGFISGALALGVSLSAASAFVGRAEAATPKRGGRLRTAVTGGASSDVLDPAKILDTYMINLSFGQLRNNLTEVSAEGKLVPELAASWDASADAKVWNLKIRRGVEFHSGKTLTSRDVVDTINHHRGEDSESAAKGLVEQIVDIKPDGKNAVEITLVGGNADFPFVLSDYHLSICPSDGNGGIDWRSGIGTGGYSLGAHNPGVRTLTKRNPNYWKEGAAFVDENETVFIPDVAARTNALRTKQIDAMNNVEVKTVSRLKKVRGIKVGSVTANKQMTLPMHTDTAPFNDKNVRLALKHIVDREQWLQKIKYGYGELGNDNPIGPANIYRATTDELPQRGYDPDKAKFYLKQAGLSKLEVTFHAAETAFEGATDAAQLMKETAKRANIDINVVRQPNDGYWSNVWLKEPWCACYWSGRPTEDWMFSQVYAADAKWNDTNWVNARFNKLLVAGRAELNPRKRRDIYVEMQQILHDDGGLILPLFISDLFATSDKVGLPATIGANLELDGGKNGERWWLL